MSVTKFKKKVCFPYVLTPKELEAYKILLEEVTKQTKDIESKIEKLKAESFICHKNYWHSLSEITGIDLTKTNVRLNDSLLKNGIVSIEEKKFENPLAAIIEKFNQ